MYKLNNHGGNM